MAACAASPKRDVVTETAAALEPAAVVDTYVKRTLEERPALAEAVGRAAAAPPPVDRIVARARVYLETVEALPVDDVTPRVRDGLTQTRLDALRTIRIHTGGVNEDDGYDERFATFVKTWLTGT